MAITPVNGTSGNDLINADSKGQVIVNAVGGNDTINFTVDTHVDVSAIATDVINAGDGDDVVAVTGDTNSNDGSAKSDLIVHLGTGNDRFYVDSTNGMVLLNTLTVDSSAGEGDKTIDLTNITIGLSATAKGGAGNDIMTADSTGKVSLSGGDGDDSINLTVNTHVSAAAVATDTIDAGAGNDVVKLMGDANGNSDTAQNDLIVHLGIGNDQFYVDKSNGMVLLNSLTVDSGVGAGDKLIDLTNSVIAVSAFVKGGNGNDTIIGTATNETLNGGAGNDMMTADSTGKESLSGGDGDDSINFTVNTYVDAAKIATDTIDAGAGNDVVKLMGDANGNNGTALNNLIVHLGNGTDEFYGDNSHGNVLLNTLTVDSGTGTGDKIFDLSSFAISDSAYLRGGIGSDTFIGSANTETLYGGAGNDVMTADSTGKQYLTGGDGDDTFNFTVNTYVDASKVATDSIDGGAGNDIVKLTDDANSVSGSAQNDLVVHLGTGNDRLYVDNAHGNVLLNTLTADSANGVGDKLVDLTNLVITGSAYVRGGINNDTIIGTTGNETLNSGLGNDVITADSTGKQFLIGSDGDDTINFTVNTYVGADKIGTDTIDVGAGNDVIKLMGDTSGDNGTAQNDLVVHLGIGNDHLYVDSSNGNILLNTLTVDTGVGVGNNIIDLTNVVIAGSAYVRGGINNDTIVGGAGDETLNGSLGNDRITANSTGEQYLIGGGGNDTLLGSLGNDVLNGGTGADSMVGGAGNDTLSYANSLAGVNVSLTAHTATGGDATGDIFSSIENIIGSAYNDTLTGDKSGNVLDGGAGNDQIFGVGNDTLIGGLGSDTLTGGKGENVFAVLLDKATDTDVIKNFNHGHDSIQITGSNYKNLVLTETKTFGGNQKGVIISDSTLGNNSGHVFVAGVESHSLHASDFLFT